MNKKKIIVALLVIMTFCLTALVVHVTANEQPNDPVHIIVQLKRGQGLDTTKEDPIISASPKTQGIQPLREV